MVRQISLLTVVFSLAACSTAPSQAIFGSYFPSWMICAGAGIAGAIVFRLIVAKAGLGEAIPAPLVIYLAIATAVAFATWLLWLD